jgi:DNA repair photolyase
MAVRFHEKDIGKALHRNRAAEPLWCARYRFSPYQNCEHGCLYCDGRAERYYCEGSFEEDITVRRNLPEVLAADLGLVREPGIIAGGSGVSDIYQPAEKSLGLTRRCAEAIRDAGLPAAIATKSDLCLRDLDIWESVARGPGVIFMTSLVTLDDGIRRIFEPGASTVSGRLEAMKKFKEAGAAVGVMAMPLLPEICDGPDAVRSLFAELKNSGADFIMPGGLTLRPGRQKDRFFRALQENRPELLPRYRELYAESRSSGSPVKSYLEQLRHRVTPVLRELRLPALIPHRIYRRMLTGADQLHILLWHMVELYGERGVDTRRLTASAKRYSAWLDGERKTFNRRRSLPADHVDEQLFGLARGGELAGILGNRRLAQFAEAVILEGAVFDYLDLKLIYPEEAE